MRQILTDIFGKYTPLLDSAGDPVQTLAGVDWEYIAGVLLFAITLSFAFRFVIAIFTKRR